MTLERLDLKEHLAVVADLAFGGREVAVPEQRHLLFERPVRVEHPLGPPVADAAGLQPGRPQPVEEAIGHRLHVTIDKLGLQPDAHARPAPLRHLGGGWPARREVHQRFVPQPGVLERQHVVVQDVVVVHQRPHRLLGRHVRELLDLLGRAAEPGPFEEVRGPVVVPVGLGDRGQIPRPRVWSGRPARIVGREAGTGQKHSQADACRYGKPVFSRRHAGFLPRAVKISIFYTPFVAQTARILRPK